PIESPLPDTIQPSIEDVLIDPDPQEVNNNVNISANITDDVDISSVHVLIKIPGGLTLGNFTMNFDPVSQRYFRNSSYSGLGTYNFTIWVIDTSWNSNKSAGEFTIVDNTNPIANAGPNQQVEQGTTVMFDGTASWDNHQIENFTWEFTDSSPIALYGDFPTYLFSNLGDFEVTLTVIDSAGNSDTDTVWINVTENLAPNTPKNLTVTTPNDKGTLVLTWDANTESDLAGYNLYRAISPDGAYVKINSDLLTNTNFTDDGLSDGTTYYYKIAAVDNAEHESPQSDWESETTVVDSEPPADNLVWLLLVILIIIIILIILIILLLRSKKNKPSEPAQ
ncbi:MAG: PKD domain-containing protein, partial [Candidatus Kariarchaeaceae archaeon]